VTYSGGATSAQYSIGGLLPIVNIATGTGGIQFLTTDGGVNYWSAGPDGSAGITQLTGPVTAGPGAGSQATTINFGGGSLSGKLPIANLAACTSAQILESNATPTQTCTSVTGDVALSATGVTTVQALQGNAVASGALTKGDALFATSTSTWAEAAFSGDLTCSTVTPGSCTLGSIDGKSLPSPPGTGTTVLTDTTGTLSWASGSGTSVTGTGLWYSASGALNSAAVQCSGDTTCSAALSGGNLPITVTQIHGASVPAAGSLTIGNVLQVSGSSTTLAYAPVNLAGGANFITGNLPVGNFAPGTSAQVLMSNATPATTWTTLTGDTTISATGVTATTKINGIAITGTPAVGNQPVATSVSSSTWSALNLAGGANYVTGNLPIANVAGNSSGLQYLTSNSGTNAWAAITAASLPTIALTGQVTGSASGGSIATTLTSANLPAITLTGAVTGSSSGGSVATTIAPGTSAQILMSNATPATTWTTLTGDTTISATGVTTTGKINGISITGTPAVGNVPIATSTTAASWSALTSSDITPGTAGQFLMTNGTPATAWQSLSGDVGAFSTGQVVVDSAQSGEITFSSGGSENWTSSATPLLTQSSVSTTTGANFTIQPQQSTNTNASGGNLLVNLEVPTGTGSEAMLEIERGGTAGIWMGGMPGNAGFWTISFAQPNSTGSNTTFFGGGGTTFINSTVQLDFDIGALGPFALVTSNGMEVAHNSADFGGGVGVIGLGVASTAPTTAPTTSGDTVLYSTTSGLFADMASTGFVTQQLAPLFTGTINSQDATFLQQGSFCRSTSTSNVTCMTIPTALNKCTYGLFRAEAKANASLAQTQLSNFLACNSSGTVSLTSLTNTYASGFGSNTGALSLSASGANVLILVNSGAAATYDWSIFATLDYD